MAAKGTIKPDHIPVNKYELLIAGVAGHFTILTISGIEEELETVELPDRTRVSGGNTKAVEFEVTTPAHHFIEQAAWELWYKEGQDPVFPTYKKVGTLLMLSISGATLRSYSLAGVFITKRGLPDLEMENEGEQAVITWGLSADDVFPV